MQEITINMYILFLDSIKNVETVNVETVLENALENTL